MAQFESYRTQGNQVDPLLFANARNSGISGGNAQTTPLQAVAQGINAGLSAGDQGILNQQAIDANKAAAQVNNTPEGVAARKRILENQAKRGELENARMETEGVALTQEKVTQAQLGKEVAETKLFDIQNIEAIGKVISSALSTGSAAPDLPDQLFKNPAYSQTFQRNPAEAIKVGAALQAQGYPATMVQGYTAPYTQMMQQQQIAANGSYMGNLVAKSAYENTKDLAAASSRLLSNSQLADYGKANSFDYRNIQLVPSTALDPNTGQLNVDAVTKLPKISAVDGKPPFYVYADVATKKTYGYVNSDRLSEAQKDLDTINANVNARGVPRVAAGEPSTDAGTGAPRDLPTTGTGLDSGPRTNASLAGSAGLSGVNQTIINQAARDRLGRNFNEGYIAQGKVFAANRAASMSPGYLSKTFSPSTITDPAVAQAMGTPVPFNMGVRETLINKIGGLNDVEQYSKYVAALVNRPQVSLDLEYVKPLNIDTVRRIEAIPELSNMPALLKGLVAVESGGNPNAVSSANAVGLTQMTPAAATDVGMQGADMTNPANATEGGYNYMALTYNRVFNELTNLTSKRMNAPLAPDPRIVLAAYNGGIADVKRALQAGNTTWDEVKEYIKTNTKKSPDNIKQNIEYPDKVISASIPFVKGGNFSDESYVQALQQYGIIQ